jgi:Lrp/AsnC family transcriptional regulator, leucine-responsive regulatory protein
MATKRKKLAAKTLQNIRPLLDEVNLSILSQLMAEPAIATRELARRVGMSAPAVAERVLRLKDGGVILRQWLEIDPASVGLGVTAFVRVRPMPGGLQKVIKLAQATPQIVECHRVTGEDCLIMKVVAANIADLEGLLDGFLAVGNTSSAVVVSSPVPLRSPPLPSV